MISEKILLRMCRDSADSDYATAFEVREIQEPLNLLVSAFGPDFLADVRNKAICDYGCGLGYQAVHLCLNGYSSVVGIDIREGMLKKARLLAGQHGVLDRCVFRTAIGPKDGFNFDAIISQNSFEHYGDPEGAVQLWRSLLAPNGRIYITFGPPWYAPYGSHVHFFTKMPWINLLFSESTVMKVRENFRQDGAKTYREVEGGLNQMSIHRFEKIIARSGMDLLYLKYRPVKGLTFGTAIPVIRELFINQVDCILKKRG